MWAKYTGIRRWCATDWKRLINLASELYSNWAYGSPADQATEPTHSCVRLTLSHDFRWQDHPCSATNAFMCQQGTKSYIALIFYAYLLTASASMAKCSLMSHARTTSTPNIATMENCLENLICLRFSCRHQQLFRSRYLKRWLLLSTRIILFYCPHPTSILVNRYFLVIHCIAIS